MGTIQTSIDLLPATGAMVQLLDGTYNLSSSIVGDSYQTLKGAGRNTILTATTADLDIITVTGSSGSEKVGILLADFCIDGDAGGVANDIGILWTYVDTSTIRNVYSIDNGEYGISLSNCDFNILSSNVCSGNSLDGINLAICVNNIVSANICKTNTSDGICLTTTCSDNTIQNNDCQGNAIGIYLYNQCSKNTISNNVCYQNGYGIEVYNTCNDNCISGNVCCSNTVYGIWVRTSCSRIMVQNNVCNWNNKYGIIFTVSNDNAILGNLTIANSQDLTNTYDDIVLSDSDRNNIQANTCRSGGGAAVPSYGINIYDATCNDNLVINNDLYDDGFGTGAYNDSGTGTIYVEPGIDDTPVDGETGQPISSNWAYDHAAAADPHAGYVLESLIDAKGDVIVGSADNTVARLAIGSDNQVLRVATDTPAWEDEFDATTPSDSDAVSAGATGSAATAARRDHAHKIDASIADDAVLTVDDADAADDDYSKFTANGLEGRSYAELVSDILPSFADQVTGVHLSQTFGASSARLLNFIPELIAGRAVYIANVGAASPFSGLINGAPTSTSVVYDTDTNENMFTGLAAYDGTNYWGQILLWNTTRATSRKIVSVNTTTNTITTTASTDSWANNDAITCQSQTNLTAGFVDLDLSARISADVVAADVYFGIADHSNTINALRLMYVHPFEAYDGGKYCVLGIPNPYEMDGFTTMMPIIGQKLTFWLVSGNTNTWFMIAIRGTYEYADT